MAAILNSAILNSDTAILDSAILVFPIKLTPTCQDWFPPFAQKKLYSFILTQLNDGSHLEFYNVGLKNFTHLFWLNLMMAVVLNSAMLDSDNLFSSLRFTQNHSHSTLTLAQLIQLDSNLFILTQLDDGSHLEFYHVGFRPCHLGFRHHVFFSLRFTQKHSHSTLSLTQTNSIWLKLIHSHSTWWWQPSWILPSWIWPLPNWIQPS